MTDNKEEPEENQVNWKISLLLCLLIFGGAALVIKYIYSTEPTAKKVSAVRKSAMLVEVIKAEKGTYKPLISALGIVEPTVDINLSPQVNGEIIKRSPNFTPGGFIKKGEIVFEIDADDYKNALMLKKSELLQAKTNLVLESGRQNIAKQEYKILNEKLSKENQDLILRKPQMDAIKAQIAYAEATIEKAELDIERTVIKAPFDAQVFSRNKDIGSQVTSGETLGRLVGLDEYWVTVTVPLSTLRWINLPDTDGKNSSSATMRDRSAWAKDKYRTGVVSKLIGELEEQTRLAKILISVKDPLALKDADPQTPKLIIGAVLKVDIAGKEIKDVVRLERQFIRANNTVWIMKDDKLTISKVNIVLKDAEFAYINDGVEEGDLIVTTNLSRVVAGSDLKLVQEKSLKQAPAEGDTKE
ncbi:MAG: efflux RND transporter periplasmic adaptor subunit [Lentisphaeraceae bacterium]|nr:efflux RND transporter periplasmic adaptor subunit [Lentisphaeraceae bacterium]